MQHEQASLREELFGYIRKTYGAAPERLWVRFPDYVIFRHEDNQKWFALIMDVPRSRLGLEGEESVDILNIKLPDPLLADLLVRQSGFFHGYHISRGNWISILLDGSVPFEEICRWVGESYLTTASREEKQRLRPPKEWLVPANPKYYDVERAFDSEKEILWKQGPGIRKGDTVFLYVAAPVSAIRFRCKVTQTDIPYAHRDGQLTIKTVMKIRLQKRYPPDRFPFEVLGREYGIFAVRGPRGIPEALSAALKR